MIKSKQCTHHFKCKFTNGLHQAYVDVDEEKGGQKEGFRPHELLEASLANCLNIVITNISDLP